MHFKLYAAIGLSLGIGWSAWAQEKAGLEGKILDDAGKPLVGVAVIRLSPTDSTLQEGVLTDPNGSFKLTQGNEGKSVLKAQALGFLPKVWAVEGPKAGQIRMVSQDQKLKEVEIVGKRPMFEMLPDRMVFNVATSINAQGNTVLDLLRKSPGVLVDKDENVNLNGKQGVRIYIDGKPTQLSGTDLANYLKALQSSDVDVIELITNPSAKYEAAGTAGIINIKLKKNKNYGTNGSVSLLYGHGVYNKHNQDINLNHRNKKWNIFGSGGTYKGNNFTTLDLQRHIHTPATATTPARDTLYNQSTPRNAYYQGLNVRFGADWYVNKRNTLGFLVKTQHHTDGANQRSTTYIGHDSTGASPVRRLLAVSDGSNLRNNMVLNLNHRYTDTAGRELSIDLDYGQFGIFSRNYQPNIYTSLPGGETTYQYAFRNYTPIEIRFGTLKADYEQRLLGGKLSVGLRDNLVQTQNTFGFYDTSGRVDNLPFNADRSYTFTYTEQVDAAYTQYQRKITNTFMVQAGLRWEQTHSHSVLKHSNNLRDSTFNRLYNNLFPSVGLTYTASKNHIWGVSMSRRLDRPDYQSLNPFENKLDELTFQRGNPYLLPQYTWISELKHTLYQAVNVAVMYSRTTNAFAQILGKADDRRTYVQNQNLARIDNVNLSISSPIPVAKWWQGFLSLNGGYNEYRPTTAANQALKSTGAGKLVAISGNGNIQNTFLLGNGYKAELSGWGVLPGVIGGVSRNRAMGSVDIGLQKMFWQDRASLKVSATDIFHTMGWTSTSDYGGIKLDISNRWESRQVKVAFSYRFGSSLVKGARNRQTGADDLSRRVGN